MSAGRDYFYQSGAGGGSSGQGGINYVTNYGFEENTGGWATYADAAGTTPVDGTGGSPNSTLTRTTTTAEILRGAAAGKFSKGAANRQGEGFSYDFTLSVQDYDGSKPLYVSFDYMTSANYANNDYRVFVYDKDGATLLNVLSLTGDGSIAAAPDPSRFVGVFYSTNGNNDYRLIIHNTSTNANAVDFIIDNVSVSPQGTVPGLMGADYGTEAWTVVNATATSSIRLTRIGNRIFADGTLSFTNTASGTIGLTIPAAYAPSTSDYSQLGTSNIIAGWSKFVDTGTGTFDGTVQLTSTSNLSFVAENAGSTYLFSSNTSNTIPHTWANTDKIMFQASWIVSGWQASAALSTTELMLTAAKSRSIGTSQTISASTATILNAATTTYDTHSAVTTGASWKFTAPKNAKYRFTCSGQYVARTYTVGNLVLAQLFKNGSFYSQGGTAGAQTTSSVVRGWDFTDTISLVKGDYIDCRAYNEGSVSTATDGFIITVEELPDFSIFSVYGITDYTLSTASSTNIPATTTFGDLASITLAPGEWDLGFNVIGHRNTASEAAWTVVGAGISTTSGNSSSGLTLGVNYMRATQTYGFGVDYPMQLGGYRVTPTSSTTYYLKFTGTYSANQPQMEGTIYARRIK